MKPNETIPGSYRMVKMIVDGEAIELLCEFVKTPSGRIIPVPLEYRESEVDTDIDSRFEGDTFKPSNWRPATPGAVTAMKPSKRDQLKAYFVMTFGDPARIEAQGHIDPEIEGKYGRALIDVSINLAKYLGYESLLPILRTWYLKAKHA